MAEITELFPTNITPKTEMVGFYMTAVYVLLIGFCVLLITARNPETKVSLCHAIYLVNDLIQFYRKHLLMVLDFVS